MKNVCAVLMSLMLGLFLCGCASSDEVILSLPRYQDVVMYTEGGFQDYTDYAIYTYGDLDESVLERNWFLHKISSHEIADIWAYIDDFEGWVWTYRAGGDDSELAAHYAFDRAVIDECDYIYIRTKEATPIGDGTCGRFDDYSVYFFDTNTNRLYYFHNNI